VSRSGPMDFKGLASPAATTSLRELLALRNGFFAADSALHVFPAGTAMQGYDLVGWNAPTLWKVEYKSALDQFVFFAEDIFGTQFGMGHDGHIIKMHVETGEVTAFAESLEEWAEKILADLEFETGCTFAAGWQRTHRPLTPTERLAPKTPFVMGGEYEIPNLYAMDAVKLMRFMGDLATQIRDLPDGSTVILKVTD
jgi:hypothetical protein